MTVEPAKHSSAYHPHLVPIEEVDALLVLSFGGPEGVDEVRPFLENVTAGRGIPPERLDEVGAHYYHFDGVSPINALNKEMIAQIEAVLASRGWRVPVYFGNRNWRPFAQDAALEIARDGHKTIAVFATSAWGGYSGCYQYGEDIQQIQAHLHAQGFKDLEFHRLGQFFSHPRFIQMMTAETKAGLDTLGADSRLVFTAHSIPVPADASSGTTEDGTLYSNQVRESAALVAAGLGIDDYDVVWQSESGNGRVPWLRPDILDHAESLHQQGIKKLVVVPIGFIADHMEVIWDLDNELAQAMQEWGMELYRVPTVGTTREFAELVVELLSGAPQPALGDTPSKGCTLNGEPCEPGCCQPSKRRPHSKTA